MVSPEKLSGVVVMMLFVLPVGLLAWLSLSSSLTTYHGKSGKSQECAKSVKTKYGEILMKKIKSFFGSLISVIILAIAAALAIIGVFAQ